MLCKGRRVKFVKFKGGGFLKIEIPSNVKQVTFKKISGNNDASECQYYISRYNIDEDETPITWQEQVGIEQKCRDCANFHNGGCWKIFI